MDIEITHSERAESTPEEVWYFWSHPETWADWDSGVEWCKLNKGHSFGLNAKATLQPKGSPFPVEVMITECIPNKRFVDEGDTPLGAIIVSHDVKSVDNGVEITHSMRFIPKNPKMLEIFKNGMQKHMEHELPIAVKTLVKMVEARYATNR